MPRYHLKGVAAPSTREVMQSYFQRLREIMTRSGDSTTVPPSDPALDSVGQETRVRTVQTAWPLITQGGQTDDPNTSSEALWSSYWPDQPLSPQRLYSRLLEGNKFSPDGLRPSTSRQKSLGSLSVMVPSAYSTNSMHAHRYARSDGTHRIH